jgi:thymidylate synthase
MNSNSNDQLVLWPIKESTHKRGDEVTNLLLKFARKDKELRVEPFEIQYAASLVNLLNNGTLSGDRTGTGTKRIQSQYFCLDVSDGKLPALRGKKIFNKKIITEAIWMFLGHTNTKFLKDFGVKYWDKWADPEGELGPIYGKQMRNFAGVDQLRDIIEAIRSNPDSRRLLMTLWNPAEIHLQKLPPCHLLYQVCVFRKGDTDEIVMDMHVTQRSGDAFLGVPYDFILFTCFFRIIAELVGLPCNKIHYTTNDYHMYLNHENAVIEYLENITSSFTHNSVINGETTLEIKPSVLRDDQDIDKWLEYVCENKMSDFIIHGYDSFPHIQAPIAV